jgi:hypothetical protein
MKRGRRRRHPRRPRPALSHGRQGPFWRGRISHPPRVAAAVAGRPRTATPRRLGNGPLQCAPAGGVSFGIATVANLTAYVGIELMPELVQKDVRFRG